MGILEQASNVMEASNNFGFYFWQQDSKNF
jgi:hypothetical protein